MIEVPKGKSADWYDGYTFAMKQARDVIQDSADEVWDAVLEAPDTRDETYIKEDGYDASQE